MNEISTPPSAGIRPRPRFSTLVDKDFLKLPAGRTMGGAFGVALDRNDHIWVIHLATELHIGLRPGETIEQRLPPVCEFDAEGHYLRGWGGPDQLPMADGISQWPQGSENICIDDDGCIWVFGYTPEDQAAVRFTPDGEFLMRFGQRGKKGSNDSRILLSTPTAAAQVGREIFFSDGYGAQRVIAFDLASGECTRIFGAYGEDPATLEPGRAYQSPVHHITKGPDGLLYVCDRPGNRVQAFDVSAGRTRFVREVSVGLQTRFMGAAFSTAFSNDGAFMYVADGSNRRIWIVGMDRFDVLGWFTADTVEGDGVEATGTNPLHRMATAPNGDLYVTRNFGGFERRTFLGVR